MFFWSAASWSAGMAAKAASGGANTVMFGWVLTMVARFVAWIAWTKILNWPEACSVDRMSPAGWIGWNAAGAAGAAGAGAAAAGPGPGLAAGWANANVEARANTEAAAGISRVKDIITSGLGSWSP